MSAEGDTVPVGLGQDVDRLKAQLAAQRDQSVDDSMTDDLVEAGTWGLAEAHAKNNRGHSVIVIRDKSFADPDVEVIRVACNGSPDQFVNGVRDCEYWEECPIPE